MKQGSPISKTNQTNGAAVRVHVDLPELLELCQRAKDEGHLATHPSRQSGTAHRSVKPGKAGPVPLRSEWERRYIHGFSPVAVLSLVALLSLLGCLVKAFRDSTLEARDLRTGFTHVAETHRERAQAAFDSGSFREVVSLLDPVALGTLETPRMGLLYARSLECLGEYQEAATAYARVLSREQSFSAQRGLTFCKRMASDRSAACQPNREADYRLHSELMKRGEPNIARFIARRLLPDVEPMRASVEILLKRDDPGARLTLSADHKCADVILGSVTRDAVELLQDLPMASLTISGAGMTDTRALSHLAVRTLDLSMNPFSDLRGLSGIRVEKLDLSDTAVADVRSLAEMPLRELNLAHTEVSSLYPLALCPLKVLDLTGLPVRDITPLRSIALQKLSLSRTRVEDLSALSSLPLQELALDRTNIYSIQALAGMKLTKLNLAGTAVKDLSVLVGMPLVELDLRGCSLIKDLSPLASCERLERVYLPPHLQALPALASLPRLKFIEYERPHFSEHVLSSVR